MEKNGSAVDAAIAALFCNGIVNGHSMGLGGGFQMVIYSARERKTEVLDAREAAPLASKPGMFKNQKEAQVGKKHFYNEKKLFKESEIFDPIFYAIDFLS